MLQTWSSEDDPANRRWQVAIKRFISCVFWPTPCNISGGHDITFGLISAAGSEISLFAYLASHTPLGCAW